MTGVTREIYSAINTVMTYYLNSEGNDKESKRIYIDHIVDIFKEGLVKRYPKFNDVTRKNFMTLLIQSNNDKFVDIMDKLRAFCVGIAWRSPMPNFKNDVAVVSKIPAKALSKFMKENDFSKNQTVVPKKQNQKPQDIIKGFLSCSIS